MNVLKEHGALLRATCAPGEQRALINFVRAFWAVVEPGAPFRDNWHIGAVCEFLEAWRAREFKNAVLNLPPGTAKSLLVDVFYLAWVWATDPGRKMITCSYDIGLGRRDAGKLISVLQSELYRAAWETRLRPDKLAAENVWTEANGNRFATTPGGKGGLGWHFHDASINDPVKPKGVIDTPSDASSQLEQAQGWIDNVLPTRRADPPNFGIMLTMQRLVQNDPAGIALDRGWEHLCLPMRYEPRAHWIRGGWSERLDQRTTPGELLHAERYPEHVVRELETALADHASAQLQQNPVPRTGGLIEEPHLRWEWVDLPTVGGHWIQVWDLAAKGTAATHSAVSGQLWVRIMKSTGPVVELTNEIRDRDRGQPPAKTAPRALEPGVRFLLVAQAWGVMTVPESEDFFEATQRDPLWARASMVAIEEKASGIGLIQRVQRKRPGVVAFHEVDDHCKALAKLDKLDRLTSTLGEWHAPARVLLPPWSKTVPDRIDPRDGNGPDALRKELTSFPRGMRDDRVDCASMALAILAPRHQGYQGLAEALRRSR